MTARALAVLLLLPGLAGAAAAPLDDPAAAFHEAGKAYESGRFGDAAELYEALVQAGWLTPSVAYNLGNARYRLGQRGHAVLWFERARRLAPRDADIRHNLAVARTHLETPDRSLWAWIDRVLTPDELPWIFAALVWALCGVLAAFLGLDLRPPRARGTAWTLLAALVFVGAWWGLRAREARTPQAIVLSPVAEVRSGPGPQYAVGFTVPEGRRTLVLNRRPGWVEIGVPSRSLKGWVQEGHVEQL